MQGKRPEGLGDRVGHLLVVQEDLDLVPCEKAVLNSDVLRGGVDPVHDVGLQGEGRLVDGPGGLQHVVGDGLGGGDRRAGIGGLETGHGLEPGREGIVETDKVCLEVAGMSRVETGQVRGDRLRHRRHGARAVPKMRVRWLVVKPEKLLHVDDFPLPVRRRRLDGAHEGVVPRSVLDDQAGGADLRGNRRACFEGVGIGVGIAQDGGHRHVLAAELTNDVRILVLSSDGLDDIAFARGRPCRASGRNDRHRDAGRHDPGPFAVSQQLNGHAPVAPRVKDGPRPPV